MVVARGGNYWIPIKQAVRNAIRMDSEVPLMEGLPVHCEDEGIVGWGEGGKGGGVARVSWRGGYRMRR